MLLKKKLIHVAMILLSLSLLLPHEFLFGQETQEKDSRMEKLFRMSLEELMNVKITTSGKTPEKIGDIPASVVLITRDDIKTFGYRTLGEILENIPGLYGIDDYGDSGLNFGVRGFWSGEPNVNVIILVNGVRQVSDYISNYPLSKIAVPVEAIDRIEVIRGPMSVVYGSGAFYGVINIITNELADYPVSIVSAALGTEKTKKLFARLVGEEGNFKYVINASLYGTDGIDKPFSKMVSDISSLTELGLTPESRTGSMLRFNEKYFNFSGTFKNLSVNLFYNEGKKYFYFSFPSVSTGTYDRVSTTHLFVKYNKELSDKVTIEGKLTYSHNRDSYKYDHLFKDFYGVQQIESNGWEAEFNAFLKPSSKLEITTGLYNRTVPFASNMYDLPSFGVPSLENNYIFLADGNVISTRALFSQLVYNPIKNLRLIAGARLEQSPKYELGKTQVVGDNPPVKLSGVYDKHQIEIIPRFAAIYYLNRQHIFKFLYGRAIKRPSFAQNAQNAFDPLLPVLEPESIHTLEINYIGTVSPEITINASVFRNTLYNLITREVKFDDNLNYETWTANAGKMVTNGVELSLNTEPVTNFRLELSGTFQKTKDKRPGFKNIAVAYSPNTLGYLKASYMTKRFTVALTGNYVGSVETFWDQTKLNSNKSFGDRIGEKVDGYFVLGANLRIDNLFLDGLYLNLRCSNLLDKEIHYPTDSLNEWATKGTIGIGRVFLLSMGYEF